MYLCLIMSGFTFNLKIALESTLFVQNQDGRYCSNNKKNAW